MKILLAAMMLAVLAGCMVYDDGYSHHRGDGWHSQGNDNDQGNSHHRRHGDDNDDQD